MRRTSLAAVTPSEVSHGAGIAKRVLVSNGEVPALTNLSQATLRPGQVATGHVHGDMWEIFLVVSGHGTMTVDGSVEPLAPGDCLVIEPGDHHELACPPEETEPLVVTYLGIAPG